MALRSEQCGRDSLPCIKKLGENPRQQEYGESLLIPVAVVSNQTTQQPKQTAEGEDRTQGRQEPMHPAQWAALQVLGKLWGIAEMGDIVNPEVGKRRAAIERIAETRTVNAACVPFSKALLDEEPDTRLLAAQTLVHLGPFAASRAIIQLRPVDLGRPEADRLTHLVESLEGFVPHFVGDAHTREQRWRSKPGYSRLDRAVVGPRSHRRTVEGCASIAAPRLAAA